MALQFCDSAMPTGHYCETGSTNGRLLPTGAKHASGASSHLVQSTKKGCACRSSTPRPTRMQTAMRFLIFQGCNTAAKCVKDLPVAAARRGRPTCTPPCAFRSSGAGASPRLSRRAAAASATPRPQRTPARPRPAVVGSLSEFLIVDMCFVKLERQQPKSPSQCGSTGVSI